MKLYYITYSPIPTKKAFGHTITKMCEKFSEEIDIVLVASENKILEGIDLFSYYKIKKNFTFKALPVLDLSKYKFLGSYLPFLIKNISFAWQTLFLKIGKNDYIYVRDIYSLLLLRWKSKNIFWEVHYLARRDKILLPLIFLAKKIIVITNFLKQQLVKFGYKKNNILVAPDGVDLKKFEQVTDNKDKLRKELNLPLDKKIVGYVGKFTTLGQDKGIKDLLAAKKILKEENELSDLIICCIGGSPAEIDQYNKLASDLGLASNDYLFVEQVSSDLVPQYCKACDILAMPFPFTEHYAYFMSPIKMFEYMASKRPIIASDLPSIREVLNESNCQFCQPNNPSDLAAKIKALLPNKKLSDKIATQAYQDVRNYTWEKRATKIINFLKS